MNWKLLAGRLRGAWLEYPETRRRIASIPAGPPIFLTGTHRSGTTWLAKMLAAPGIWYIHEPFSPEKGRWPKSFDYRRSEVADADVDALFDEVLSGGFRAALNMPNADYPMMPLRLFKPRLKRMLIKDPLGCLLTEYLTTRYQLQTVILFRHPAGFVSSVRRLGWPLGSFLRQFLDDGQLMTEHLEPHRNLLEKYSGEDSVESAAVLHGALNTVLWSYVKQGVGSHVMFEDLCQDPINKLQGLFEVLQLPYDERTREIHQRACFGDVMSVEKYHPHAVSRNSMAMARSWAGKIASDELTLIREIWQQFGIPLYDRDEDWTP
ncbi:sulfotransferase [Thermomonas sp.]|uniref:sulfotransferase n=1 Tax=Thermomonas sp. TaxID=1971895 RepID=UPI00248882CD|nr:sulfotransferase [Thermomonas sp.]MDI1253510.1 sulfotransferase [Thermomonas sp.]